MDRVYGTVEANFQDTGSTLNLAPSADFYAKGESVNP